MRNISFIFIIIIMNMNQDHKTDHLTEIPIYYIRDKNLIFVKRPRHTCTCMNIYLYNKLSLFSINLCIFLCLDCYFICFFTRVSHSHCPCKSLIFKIFGFILNSFRMSSLTKQQKEGYFHLPLNVQVKGVTGLVN